MRVGRSGVSGAARGHSSARAAGAGLHASALSLSGPHRRSGTRGKPDEVVGAVQGRACVRGEEAEIWLYQGALPRIAKECQPPVRDLRSGESLSGAPAVVVYDGGVVSPNASASPGRPASVAKRTSRGLPLGLKSLFTVTSPAEINPYSEVP